MIEVAVSSLEIDRVKAHIYAEAGVKEYWIVCPEEKQVEVYRQPGVDGYAERSLLAAPAAIECSALPGVCVDLAALLPERLFCSVRDCAVSFAAGRFLEPSK